MILLGLLGGCGGDLERATWLEGFGYGWTHFNHRVSQWVAETDDSVGRLAFVGGTSTTGIDPVLPPECTSGCEELPFTDTWDGELRYGAIATRDAGFAAGSVVIVAGVDGATGEVTATFAHPPKGEVFGVLRGLRLATDEALEGEPGCYDPALGWHPRRVAVAIQPAVVDGASVTLSVSGWFEAGNSLEAIRTCIDEVHTRARVRITVDVLLVAASGPVSAQEIAGGMVFPWAGSPEPQVPTDEVDLDPAFGADSLVGWSALDWRFFESDPDDRGAYLRTLDLGVDVATGSAHGQATSYSPGTQVSGFDYGFTGTLVGVQLAGQWVHGNAGLTAMAAALGADGSPVVTEVELEPPPDR